MKKKILFIAFTAVMLLLFACPQQTLAKKEKYYLGHRYEGKMKKKIPVGEGTITIGDIRISGTFVENNTITNAAFFTRGLIYHGDIIFDKSYDLILRNGGILTYPYKACQYKLNNFSYGDERYKVDGTNEAVFEVSNRIEIEKKWSYASLFPDTIFETVIDNDQLSFFKGKTITKYIIKRDNDRYYYSYDSLLYSCEHFCLDYIGKKYQVVKTTKKSGDYRPCVNLYCDDGSYFIDSPVGEPIVVYPDGSSWIFKEQYNTSLVGVIMTPEGMLLAPAYPIHEGTSDALILPYGTSFDSHKKQINAYLNRYSSKRFKVGAIGYKKFEYMPKEEIETKVKEALDKYLHRDTVIIYSEWEKLTDGEYQKYLDNYNQKNFLGYFINGRFKTKSDLRNEILARREAEERRKDSLENALQDEMRTKLSKKYGARLVDNCFNSEFKGAPISLVKEYIEYQKNIINTTGKIYRTPPLDIIRLGLTNSVARKYGRDVDYYALFHTWDVNRSLFVDTSRAICIVVKNGKVIAQW